MTTLAITEPALRRLFDRLDFAPQPKDESLALLFEYWIKQRGNRTAPISQEIKRSDLKESATDAFMVQYDHDRNAPALMFGGASFETLVGPCDPGAMLLAEASQRRGLVRLRRLADLVRRRAEPVLVEFSMRAAGGEPLRVEMFLAPLSNDNRSVDGLFGGIALRHVHSDLKPGFHAHLRRPGTAPLLLLTLNSARELGQHVARHLGQALQSHEERDFEDGEHTIRPLTPVRGRHVYVIAGLHGDKGQSVNDRLCRLLFFVAALKDAGATRVNVVAPYLCYARKDRQTKPQDPVTSRYIGQLFEAVGGDCLITMEVHNLAAFQNAFRCNTIHLTPYTAFCKHLVNSLSDMPVAIVSPDIGGAKRVELFRQELEFLLRRPVSKCIADKQRSMGRISGDLFAGDVSGCTAVILDDLISTGTTMARVAAQCREHGARRVIAAATHGVGGVSALPSLLQPEIDEVLLSNTIPQVSEFTAALGNRLTVIDISDVIAQSLLDCFINGNIDFS